MASATGYHARTRTKEGQDLLSLALTRLAAAVVLTGAVLALILALGPGASLSVVAGGAPPTVRLNQQPAHPQSSGCDPDGVSVHYQTVFRPGGYVVAGVTVSGVDAAACAHQAVIVTLTDAQGATLGQGSATVPAEGSDVHVPMTGAPSAASTTGVTVTMA